MSDEIINEVSEIKHMAFAVEDIDESLDYYKKYLGVSKDVQIQDMPKWPHSIIAQFAQWSICRIFVS